ncbi:IPT/TIG domain-containing protein [Dyella japonica]|uniref:YD repeat-containing protein n=1 Tax=Dyella japonica TaxID=231455 RepID=A0ABV2JYJ2_9GAMM
MDSQGCVWMARARAMACDGMRGAVWLKHSAIPFRVALVLLALLCWNVAALAQSSNYAYDANGRLVGVTQNDNAAQYSYDANGNLLQISSAGPGQLAIFSFMPTHGAAGTQVVVSGKGFASTPASNAVTFSGAGATVLSASANQLVVTVPNGASTGPISVTAGMQTAASSSPFVIDNTGLPPVITQISPNVATAGSTLTTTGTHLYPVTGETTVQIGGQQMSLSGALDTRLQSAVPANGSSGYVAVQTPYGKARSLAPVIVVPPSINPANVVSTGYVSTAGQTASLNIPAANQIGAVLFDGTIGSWLSLQAGAITTTSSAINFTVYAPGNVVMQTGSISSTAPSIHLAQLPANGTYLVTFTPTTAAAQMTLSLEANSVLAAGQPLNVVTPGGWQNKRFLINTLVGQDLELTLNNVTVGTTLYPSLTAYVYNAVGTQVAKFTCNSNNPGGSCLQHFWQTAGGMYTVIVVPGSAATMSFNAVLQRDSVSPLSPNSAQAVALPAGQVQRFTFTGQAGQFLAIQANASTTPAAGGVGVTYQVYRPDAGPITSATTVFASFDTANVAVLNLPALPVSGTYTIVATADYGLAATGQVQLYPSTTGGITTNGAATKLTANGSGQSVYFTFTATQGEDLELTLNQLTVAGNSSVNVYVYNSAGGQVTYTTCYVSSPAGSCILNLWGMWAGTYTVFVSQTQGGPMSFNVLLQDVIKGGSLQVGTPQAINLGAGQAERYTFNANAGDTLAVNLSNLATIPGNQPVAINVYLPDGGGAIYASTRTDSVPTVNLPNLPVSGTYSIVVIPFYGLPMTGQVAVLPGLAGNLVAGDQPTSFASSASGQIVYMTFTAQQDDDLELLITHMSVTAASYAMATFNIVDSNGNNITSANCSAQKTSDGTELPSCEIHLWHLQAGTYRITASLYSLTGIQSFSAQLQRDVLGPDLTSGNPVTVNNSIGQVERFTFSANAGDTVALQLANVSTTPTVTNRGVTFYVYQPPSAISRFSNVYASTDVMGTSTFNLRNLPFSGKYTVIMVPDMYTPATAQLRLYGGSVGALPNTGAQQSVTTNVSGQASYLTFAAQAGDNLELALNGVTISGGGSAIASVNVYNAAGSQITSFNCAQSNPNGSCMQPLWNLAAGTYTAIVSPYSGSNGGTLKFNASLQPDIVGPPLTVPGYQGFLLNAGQVERVTFSGRAGDTVKFLVQNESTWPTGYGVTLAFYRPDIGAFSQTAASFASYLVTSSLQNITLPVLPVSGTYTMVVMPQYGLQGNAQVSLVSDASTVPVYGTPTFSNNGTPITQTASAAGQNVTMTFNANDGDNLQLTFSGINVIGASTNGFRVDVYDPSGKQVTWANCYASNPGGACRFTLWNLIAGSYKVVASPSWGGTINFNAQIMPDIVGPALAANTLTPVSLPLGGVERLTFTANAGDNISLALSGASTTPAGQPVSVNVYRPDTGFFGTPYATTSTTSASAINLANLPASGTYTVVVYTAYGEPGSVNLNFVPASLPALVKDAAARSVSTAAAGQAVYTTFNAARGDNLELTLGNLQGNGGASISAQIQVLGPAGNQVSYGTCYSSSRAGNCHLSLWNLAPGQYSVLITPQSTVQMSFAMQLLTDITGPALAFNAPTPVSLAFGQVERVTFSANAGDTVALNLASVSTVPSGGTVTATIYRPDSGIPLTSFNNGQVSTGGSTVLNLPDLFESGTYTVVLSSDNAEPAQATLTLLPGITGTVAVGAMSPTYGTSIGGQNTYLTFSANRGDNLEFSLLNNTGSVAATVYDKNHVQVGTLSCSSGSKGASCVNGLWNLAGGDYSIVVTSSYGYSFNVLIKPDTLEPPITLNVPLPISLSQGETQRYTFNANLGDNLALTLSNVVSNPSGQGLCADVYRPDNYPRASGYYGNEYVEICSSNGPTVNMTNMPVGGTYTVILTAQPSGVPVTGTMTLGNGLQGSLVADGPSQSFTAQQTNEKYNITLHTNPGDNLELAFNSVNVPQNTFTSAIAIQLYDPAGRQVYYSGTCGGAVCMFPLWNASGGDYKAVVSPGFNGAMTFNAQLVSDVVGPLLDSAKPTLFSIPQGHIERFTFNAAAGQNIALTLSSIQITPANQTIYMSVYRPDAGAILTDGSGSASNGNYYAQLSTSNGGTLNMPSMPVSGTYTVLAYATYGVPFSGQLALNPAFNPTLVADGDGQTMALTTGARTYLSLGSSPGDNLELTLDNMVASGGSNGLVSIGIYDASGKNVSNFNCSAQTPGASCNLPLWNLAGGTYGVAISGSATGTVQVRAKLKRDVMGGLLTSGNPILFGPTTTPVERFMFNANAGDNLALQLANITTSPNGQPVSIYVYRPDVGTITPANAYAQTSSSDSSTLSLPNLPVSGTYTVIVIQNGGLPSAASLSLSPQ